MTMKVNTSERVNDNVSLRVWPSGTAVKVALCFGGLGFASSDPGYRPMHCLSSHAVTASHKHNRGRLPQMLAQQQSSSREKKKFGNRC